MRSAINPANKVLVFGTFDLLHPGHISFLEQAKDKGSHLFVVVARDRTVRMLKGKDPMDNEDIRLASIRSLKCVKKAVLGSLKDHYSIIRKLSPDLICLGYDQKGFAIGLRQRLRDMGLHSAIVRLKPFKPHLYKSAKLKRSMG